jgi:hypothetical protein
MRVLSQVYGKGKELDYSDFRKITEIFVIRSFLNTMTLKR